MLAWFGFCSRTCCIPSNQFSREDKKSFGPFGENVRRRRQTVRCRGFVFGYVHVKIRFLILVFCLFQSPLYFMSCGAQRKVSSAETNGDEVLFPKVRCFLSTVQRVRRIVFRGAFIMAICPTYAYDPGSSSFPLFASALIPARDLALATRDLLLESNSLWCPQRASQNTPKFASGKQHFLRCGNVDVSVSDVTVTVRHAGLAHTISQISFL